MKRICVACYLAGVCNFSGYCGPTWLYECAI